MDAFTSNLQLLTNKSLTTASDLEKCELFDKLDQKQKRGFWTQIGAQVGKTNLLAGVMYQNFKRKVQRANTEKAGEADRLNLKQKAFVDAFTLQLEILTEKQLAASSDLDKCELFDSLGKQKKQGFWSLVGSQTGMENWQACEMYHNFKKKVIRKQDSR